MNKLAAIMTTGALALACHAAAAATFYVAPQGRDTNPDVKFEDNLVDVDPLFAGEPPADFRLAEESPAHNLGFQNLPLEKIGVYQSDDRASWPVEHTILQSSKQSGP